MDKNKSDDSQYLGETSLTIKTSGDWWAACSSCINIKIETTKVVLIKNVVASDFYLILDFLSDTHDRFKF